MLDRLYYTDSYKTIHSKYLFSWQQKIMNARTGDQIKPFFRWKNPLSNRELLYTLLSLLLIQNFSRPLETLDSLIEKECLWHRKNHASMFKNKSLVLHFVVTACSKTIIEIERRFMDHSHLSKDLKWPQTKCLTRKDINS